MFKIDCSLSLSLSLSLSPVIFCCVTNLLWCSLCSGSGSGTPPGSGTPHCEELYGSVFLDVVSGTAHWSPELPPRPGHWSSGTGNWSSGSPDLAPRPSGSPDLPPRSWSRLTNQWTTAPIHSCKQHQHPLYNLKLSEDVNKKKWERAM